MKLKSECEIVVKWPRKRRGGELVSREREKKRETELAHRNSEKKSGL